MANTFSVAIDVTETPTETIDIDLTGSSDPSIKFVTDTSILAVNRIVYNKASVFYRVFLTGTFQSNNIGQPSNLIGQVAPITLATEATYNASWEIKGTGETGGNAFFEIDGPSLISSIASGISNIDDLGGAFDVVLDTAFGTGYGGAEHLSGFSGVITNSDEPQYDGTWLISGIPSNADLFSIAENGFGNTTTDAGTWTINNVPVEQELTGTSAIFTVEITREVITIGVS